MDEVGTVKTVTCCDHDKKCQSALKSLNKDTFCVQLLFRTSYHLYHFQAKLKPKTKTKNIDLSSKQAGQGAMVSQSQVFFFFRDGDRAGLRGGRGGPGIPP